MIHTVGAGVGDLVGFGVGLFVGNGVGDWVGFGVGDCYNNIHILTDLKINYI